MKCDFADAALRVPGLIKKVAGKIRYLLTTKGREFAQALITVSDLAIKELTDRVA